MAMVTLAFIMFYSVLTASVTAQTASNQVQIDSGMIKGALSGDVLSFKGIPYAAPPVGDLRWRAPQPVASWHGARKTTAYGHDCVQLPIPGDAGASGSTRGEDCLVLNVWRPATIKSGEKLPVYEFEPIR